MKLMILDGNSVINRAFYGVRPLTTRDGLYTNAIYGFLNILEKERSEEKPDALCVAFDLHAPTFRHLRYDGYKATRHPMPEELAMQMPVMKQVLAAMNIPVYACEGWEADDVLGTVGRLCEEAGWDCVILTGDRDSLQLVDEHVSVRLVHTQGGQTRTERYTPDVFRAEYGLEPKRLIDLKALMGDSSDNIPGRRRRNAVSPPPRRGRRVRAVRRRSPADGCSGRRAEDGKRPAEALRYARRRLCQSFPGKHEGKAV